MKLFKRILIGLLILLTVAFTVIYFYLQSTKPALTGIVLIKGLEEEVTVYFDTYGIPHIYASNETDAYYALGYVHAQDRLFQMEMLRRAASGRLAEVLGEELLPVDKLFRTLGLNQFAKAHAAKFLSTDTAAFQRAALAYQRGVNHFINTGKTPIEFTLIGIPKTEFTPEDFYLAVGFMSFGFAEGFNADPVLEKIRQEYGEAYLQSLAIQTPPDAVRIPIYKGQVQNRSNDQLISALHDALEKLPVAQWQGSNGWVISGQRTQSGFPILANDTHIGFAQPAVWYEAHLEYPGFSFYGHHLAGFPFGLLGNNRFCGVGLTMFENDDVDFYREVVNPDNNSQVKHKDAWENLSTRIETIKVKGKADVQLEVRSSRHGPLINAIVPNTDNFQEPVSLAWQLLMLDNHALRAAYELNHATSYEQAQAAVSKFSAPGLNVMYGDVDGNIAWWAAARLPVRPAHMQSKLFLDGASGNDEYLGYYDFTKNPQALNPPWGFVYSANNQPDSVEGVLYPGYYYPKSRSGRIIELLAEGDQFSIDYVKRMALDVTSHMNAEVAHLMASILETSTVKNEFTELINALKNWNGEDTHQSVASSIYYNMLSQTLFMAMEDELGTTALKSLLATSIPKNSYARFIGDANSPWWDNVKTKDTKEKREEIIVAAARKTIKLLTTCCGKNGEGWNWEKIHTLTHGHPLGMVKPLDRLFNVGPFAVPGGSEVINNLHFKLDTTGYFPVSGGPALRKITDFGDLDHGITVSPTGQSGNVMSPHYDDQAVLFATGKFRTMLMNKEEIKSNARNTLILKPPAK